MLRAEPVIALWERKWDENEEAVLKARVKYRIGILIQLYNITQLTTFIFTDTWSAHNYIALKT